MRSSNKSRSRNKGGGRSRGNIGNIVNRVFESAGPEGKVRGTPQQIIEKYQALARDAQLSNDRVAAENFQQHSEHYTRLLNEAQREQAERQAAEDRRRQPQQGQGQSDDDGGDDERESEARRDDRDERPDERDDREERRDDRRERFERAASAELDVVDDGPAEDTGLVDTPENSLNGASEPPQPARKPRGRPRRAASKATADGGADQKGDGRQVAEPPVQ